MSCCSSPATTNLGQLIPSYAVRGIAQGTLLILFYIVLYSRSAIEPPNTATHASPRISLRIHPRHYRLRPIRISLITYAAAGSVLTAPSRELPAQPIVSMAPVFPGCPRFSSQRVRFFLFRSSFDYWPLHLAIVMPGYVMSRVLCYINLTPFN